jgi:alpha-aminoadipic semialdehyde synthase
MRYCPCGSALDADVLFLNEIGLDPGIDHLSAMEMRDRLQREGKRIASFISWCGGLPAPEDSNVSVPRCDYLCQN